MVTAIKDTEQLLDLETTAHRLGVSPQTVRRLTQRATLPHSRIGHQLRYNWGEVAAAVAVKVSPASNDS